MVSQQQPKLPKKHAKYGRKERPVKHHLGQFCGLKNCYKLAQSRKWNERLQIYMAP
jgi:hypothetical protein